MKSKKLEEILAAILAVTVLVVLPVIIDKLIDKFHVPHFKNGDCVFKNISDEFSKNQSTYQIIGIGKLQYATRFYVEMNETAYAFDSPFGRNIRYIDSEYAKTNCPKKFVVFK